MCKRRFAEWTSQQPPSSGVLLDVVKDEDSTNLQFFVPLGLDETTSHPVNLPKCTKLTDINFSWLNSDHKVRI